MTPKTPSQHRLAITENWHLKLISLIIAAFLWYFVVGEEKVDMNVAVPVSIVNLPQNLVISNQFKKQLEVTVSGSRGVIRNLVTGDITRAIDLAKATPGTMVIRNEADAINFPSGIKVQRIQPPYIILNLDELFKKELAVQPILIGAPAEGFEITAVEPSPPTLELSGPKSILGNETYLHTIPLDITGINHSEVRHAALELNQTLAELIGEPTITVNLRVREKRLVKVLSKVPIIVKNKNLEYRYVLRPASITVEAEFPFSATKNVDDLREYFQAEIDASALDLGMHESLVNTFSRDGTISILFVSPETVTLEISKTMQPRKQKLRITPEEGGQDTEPTENMEESHEKTIRN